MECAHQTENLDRCGCTYVACSRKGKCCDCIAHHRKKNELPGCLFPPEAEKTYDRSVAAYLKAVSR